ncbi:FAD-dependent oxidoreductase [Crossiella cryophila]|uniref:2-polyprenyl-6-methoxyphenol hydroxylase-like FAD-dependent oxidoreductase n=1 Tax=Crossiella cryophila TaxID=43355 RepID=A0A7W7CHL6_9PSEU|nr:FAD-dependent oxidoreductase [Crossiella cryophila]MBB4679878.1 2-polyprenyl-6-methoxyphenol hydroxylase-like FAD-dependent oxidoreductase [Crossiella cryophila]
MRTQVIVVGAGPTGLMLAHELRLAGVSTLVLERLTEPNPQSRAGSLQPRTAEVLDLRGLLTPLLDGVPLTGLIGGHFAALPVPLDCTPWQTRYPTPVPVSQGRLEEFLEQRVIANGGEVRRGTEVLAVSQTEHGVQVNTTTGDTLHADYLVACDGAHSTVRKHLAMAFPGQAATIRSVVADIVLTNRPVGTSEGGRHFSEMVRGTNDYWTVLHPLGDGVYRFMFGSLTEPSPPRDQPVTEAETRAALQAVYGPEIDLTEIRAASRFSNASRQLTNYRANRVFFAGDAAHIHLPVGGQGVNLGVQDAMNLGWKLAAQLSGQAPEGLLDTYQSERHPVAAGVLANTQAQGVLLNPGGAAEVAALRDLMTGLLRLPEVNRHLSGMVSGLDIRYDLADGAEELVGRRMPDLDVVSGGGVERVAGLTHAGRGLLLRFDDGGSAGVVGGWADRVDQVEVKADGWRGSVLVRPDGHVCWAGSGDGDGGLGAALTRWFGAPTGR